MPYANLAAMLLEEGRPAEALPYLQQALRMNPKSARDFCLAGEALLRQGAAQPAVRYLQRSANLDPGYAEPQLFSWLRPLGITLRFPTNTDQDDPLAARRNRNAFGPG